MATKLEIQRQSFITLVMAENMSDACFAAEREFKNRNFDGFWTLVEGRGTPSDSGWMADTIRESNELEIIPSYRGGYGQELQLWLVEFTFVRYQEFTPKVQPQEETSGTTGGGDTAEAGEDRPDLAVSGTGSGG